MKVMGYELTLRRDVPEEKSKIIPKAKDYSESVSKSIDAPLTLVQMRKNVQHEPILYKAIRKKCRDTFRNGFCLVKKNGNAIPAADAALIDEFMDRTHLLKKFEQARISSHIYGDGYIEKQYLHDKGTKPNMKPADNDEPIHLINIDSEKIHKKAPGYDGKGLFYYYHGSMGDDVLIHPSRLIHIMNNPLPYSFFGTSDVETLKSILKSKMNADLSCGETLDRSGYGIRDMMIKNMTDDQKKEMMTIMERSPQFFVHDDDYTLQVVNPQMGNPKYFYDYFFINIGAQLMMPKHILTGESPSNAAGSELGIGDYYNDIENEQNLVLTPLLEDLFKEVLEANGREWKYYIRWNPTFVDEMTEGKIMEKRTLCGVQGYVNKIVGREEARRILRDGVISIDPSLVPKDLKEDVVKRPPMLPNVEPNTPKEEEKKVVDSGYIHPLSSLQREMIRKAKEERLRGEFELKEQEERVKEAETKKK